MEEKASEEEILATIVGAAERAGLPKAFIHAIRKTGRIVGPGSEHVMTDEEIEEWNAAVAEGERLYGSSA